jgi:hypothetical protein
VSFLADGNGKEAYRSIDLDYVRVDTAGALPV